MEAPSGLGRFLGGGGTAIQGGIYCTYDAFARCDVRCELRVPGGVTCHALDGCGEARAGDDALGEEAWRRVRVSAALRALRAQPAPLLHAGALRRLLHSAAYAPPPSPRAEGELLEDALALRCAPDAAAAALALAGRGPGTLPEGARHWERAHAEDVLLNTLLRHFLSRHRTPAAVAFFRRALAADAAPGAPSAAAPLARALMAAGAYGDADAALCDAIAAAPGDAPALRLLLASCRLRGGDAPAALDAAAAAAAAAPGCRAVWLRLAAALAACNRFGDALVALNCAPFVGVTEEDAADAWRGYFPSGRAPRAARRTAPAAWNGADAAQEAELACWDESALPGRPTLASLPAAALLPPPAALPYATGHASQGAPLQPAARAAAGAYSVLVDLVTALGWEGFLNARGSVFVMDAAGGEDTENESESETEEEGEPEQETAAAKSVAAAAAAPQPRRAGTRDAGVRAAGAPPPGSLPSHAACADAPAAPDAAADAADAPATDAPAPEPASPRVRSRGEAEAVRDRRALCTRAALAPKRLCAEWLDVLIGALYADVAEYSAWRTAEAADAAQARAEAGRVAATADAAAPAPANADAGADDTGGAAAPEEAAADADADGDAAAAAVDTEAALGTAGDWARRGALCERLKRADDAERAYRVCVHLGFHASAWAALARLYAAWGWAPEALTACAQLAAGADAAGGDAPGWVAPPLAALIAAVGLQAARGAQEALGGAAHAAVNEAFHDAVRWQAHGWDK